jgi:hypothetical protein
MIINYKNKKSTLKIETDNEEISFLQSDKKGSYFSLGIYKNNSFYQGMIFPKINNSEWEMYKSIEDIRLINSEVKNIEINQTKNNIKKIHTNGLVEQINLIDKNTIYYSVQLDSQNNKDQNNNPKLEQEQIVELILDCKRLYDFSDIGRIYKDYGKKENIRLIKYTKYSNPELNNQEYSFFVGLKNISKQNSIPVMQWIQKSYEYDNSRSHQKTHYVYNLCKFILNKSNNYELKLIIKTDFEESKIQKHLKNMNSEKDILNYKKTINLYSNENYQINENSYIKNLENEKLISKKEVLEIIKSKNIAINSFDDLITKIDSKIGIFAGFYWFFQFWSRDEAISIGGLIKEKSYDLSKKILIRQISDLLPDGRISNRLPHSNLGSADGVGWSFFRIKELLEIKEAKIFTNKEIKFIKEQLDLSIKRLLEHHTKFCFAVSNKKETWMDTSPNDCDNRIGARIEIQALRLAMYSLGKKLNEIISSKKIKLDKTKNNNLDYEYYNNLEEKLKLKVKNTFLINNILSDGFNPCESNKIEDIISNLDQTVRPNIFLTYYIYPELFDNNTWKSIFEKALEKLWLEWGGISTIDIFNELFKEYYTGESNESYHRGDSWFFINNITAICLKKVDSNYFKDKIQKILNSSKTELLKMGILGSIAEVSNAKELSSKGTWQQAWSISTYIELINELFK